MQATPSMPALSTRNTKEKNSNTYAAMSPGRPCPTTASASMSAPAEQETTAVKSSCVRKANAELIA